MSSGNMRVTPPSRDSKIYKGIQLDKPPPIRRSNSSVEHQKAKFTRSHCPQIDPIVAESPALGALAEGQEVVSVALMGKKRKAPTRREREKQVAAEFDEATVQSTEAHVLWSPETRPDDALFWRPVF